MKFKILVFLFSIQLYGQNSQFQDFQFSGINYFKFGKGRENYGEGGFVGKRDKNIFENYTDLRLFFPEFSFGFRIEESNPPEYGIKKRGIVKKYVDYKNGNISIRAGSIYELFGRGLTLNLFENRSLAFDTGIDGIKTSYETENLNFKLIAGKLNYLEPLTLYEPTQRFEKYNLAGASIEFPILQNFKMQSSILFAQSNLQNAATKKTENLKSLHPEVTISWENEILSLYTSYSQKNSTIDNFKKYGFGVYSMLQFTGDKFGVVAEYKNYFYDDVNPEERNNFKRSTRALPFQNAPIVHKEHSYTLLKRYPHVVDFNDEVGIQVDAFFSINDKTTLNLNSAAASRHFEYELNSNNWTSVKKENSKIIFPTFDSVYSPFYELFAEVEHFFESEEEFIKIAINKRSEIIYDIFNPTKKSQLTKTFTIPTEMQFLLSSEYSFRANLEMQCVTKFPYSNEYKNYLVAIQFSKVSFLSAGLRYEFTTNTNEPNGKQNWLVFESALRAGKNHTFILSYGNERGGQVCSNGLCRTLLPFEGLRLSLTSVF